MKTTKLETLLLSGILAVGAGVFSGCNKSDTDKTRDALQDTGEKTKDALKDAGEKTKEAVKEAADKTGDALNKAGDKLKEAANTNK